MREGAIKMKVHEMKPHPLNIKIYGEIDDGLVESIKKHGIKEPIVIKSDGTIISGHRRWKAAVNLGLDEIPYRVEDYPDELSEQEALIEYNRQREKTYSQKMAEAEKLKEIEAERAKRRQEATQLAGKNSNGLPIKKSSVVEILPPPNEDKGKTRDKVAEKLGMSGRTYDKAEKVWQAAKQGDEVAKKLVDKLDKGQTTISAAYKQLVIEQEKRKAVEQIKKLEPPSGLYEVIVIDPPWAYEKRAEDESHRGRCPYPTMTVEEIKSMKMPAADNCILWLWTTNAFMHDAFHVLEAWGFTPKTILTWVKDKIGLGDWLRGQTEHCILAVKGKPIVTLTNQSTVIYGPLREHSRKPDEFYQLVESLCPGRKLEMFARQKRDGWDVYGAETEKF